MFTLRQNMKNDHRYVPWFTESRKKENVMHLSLRSHSP